MQSNTDIILLLHKKYISACKCTERALVCKQMWFVEPPRIGGVVAGKAGGPGPVLLALILGVPGAKKLR